MCIGGGAVHNSFIGFKKAYTQISTDLAQHCPMKSDQASECHVGRCAQCAGRCAQCAAGAVHSVQPALCTVCSPRPANIGM